MVGFVVYEVDPGGSFQKALKDAEKLSDDLSPAFQLIAQDFYQTQGWIFKLSTPGPFRDLTAKYKARKRSKFGRVYPILKANGFLETAATVQGGSGNITEITPKTASFAIDPGVVKYAIFHNKGGKKIPKRPFFFIGPEESAFASAEQLGRIERWTQILSEFYAQKLKESGVGETKA